MKNFIFISLIFLAFITISCDNSVELRDGYTLYGKVTDSDREKSIPLVNIFVGYNTIDSLYFSGYLITSDSLGKFVFHGGPGTAPSDEILRFEHPEYFTKDVLLKGNTSGDEGRFYLSVKLQPK